MPQRYVDAQYLRLLHRETVRRADAAAELAADTAADTAADGSADVRAECKSNGASDEYAHNCEADATTDATTQRIAYGSPNHITPANVGAFPAANDAASDGSADVRANSSAVSCSVHDCVCLTGDGVRRRSRRQLLRWRGRMRGR